MPQGDITVNSKMLAYGLRIGFMWGFPVFYFKVKGMTIVMTNFLDSAKLLEYVRIGVQQEGSWLLTLDPKPCTLLLTKPRAARAKQGSRTGSDNTYTQRYRVMAARQHTSKTWDRDLPYKSPLIMKPSKVDMSLYNASAYVLSGP